ncbi:MAG: hypothetical protein HC877_18990 [Thioploca sp.]|nr:hypothetical protein [Thioploca sp.]
MRKGLIFTLCFILGYSTYVFAQAINRNPSPEQQGMPGTTIASGFISCVNATTVTAIWNIDTDPLNIDTYDYFAIPHGSRLLLSNSDLLDTAFCAIVSSPVATLGNPANNSAHIVTDDDGPNGSGVSQTITLTPGSTKLEIVDYYKTLYGPGARSRVCSHPVIGSKTSSISIASTLIASTSRVRDNKLSVFTSCIDNTECVSIAGNSPGTTCLSQSLSNSLMAESINYVRGLYLKCNCTGAARIDWAVNR